MPTIAEVVYRDVPARLRQAMLNEPSCRSAVKRLHGLLEPDEEPLAAARGWAADERPVLVCVTKRPVLVCVTNRRVVAMPIRSNRNDVLQWPLDDLRAVVSTGVPKRRGTIGRAASEGFDVLVLLPPSGEPDYVNVSAGYAHRLANAAQPPIASNGAPREKPGDWWTNPELRLAIRYEGKLVAWSDRATPPGTAGVVWITSNGVRVRLGNEATWIGWSDIVDFAVADAREYVRGLGGMGSLPAVLIVDTNHGRFIVAVQTAPNVLAVQLSTPLHAFGHTGSIESATTAPQETTDVLGAAAPTIQFVMPTSKTRGSTGATVAGQRWEQVAIVSFVLGVLSLLTYRIGAEAGWFGIGIGIWALRRIERSTEVLRGKALAWWGIGLSIAAIAAFAANVSHA